MGDLIADRPFLAHPFQTGRKRNTIPLSSWDAVPLFVWGKSSYSTGEGHGSPQANRTRGLMKQRIVPRRARSFHCSQNTMVRVDAIVCTYLEIERLPSLSDLLIIIPRPLVPRFPFAL